MSTTSQVPSRSARPTATGFDRMLAPLHRWIWSDADRRLHKLLRFGETETDGGRDLLRAAEVTRDPLLRRLYLVHATDEQRHGQLFKRRAASLLRSRSNGDGAALPDWLSPGGHGLDDLRVDEESDDTMLAFLHVSEKGAASRFRVYHDVLDSDPETRSIFSDILHDEMFHMNYTLAQLVRVSPERHRTRLWRARMTRLWKAYLRVASALAGAIGAVILTIQYFTIVPLFAWFAKRSSRREPEGWRPISNNNSLRDEY